MKSEALEANPSYFWGWGNLPHKCENYDKNIEGVQISALQTCVFGDINEDILLTSEKQCCSMLCRRIQASCYKTSV